MLPLHGHVVASRGLLCSMSSPFSEISTGANVSRHRWGEPLRFERKTERECANCGLVKVTRHEFEGGQERHWTEFWRGLDRIECDGTPACEPFLERVR